MTFDKVLAKAPEQITGNDSSEKARWGLRTFQFKKVQTLKRFLSQHPAISGRKAAVILAPDGCSGNIFGYGGESNDVKYGFRMRPFGSARTAAEN